MTETPRPWRDGRESEIRVRAMYAVVTRLFGNEMLDAEKAVKLEVDAENAEGVEYNPATQP